MGIRIFSEEEADQAPDSPTEEEAAELWRSVYTDDDETNTGDGDE